MINLVKYRGPDDAGIVLFAAPLRGKILPPLEIKLAEGLNSCKDLLPDFMPDYTCGLGHCRLSIIDLTPKGHQPMSDEEKTLWIVHNGEIYNFLEIRKELMARGYHFRSDTDTEVILYAYKEWGVDCLQRFNGDWSFALWDDLKKILICARDRFAVKPFYYYLSKDIFIFSSEIKQILLSKNYQPQVNEDMIYDFLVIGLEDHTSETMFKGIQQLRGGEMAVLDYRKKTFRKERYYDLPLKILKEKDPRDLAENFKHLFFDAVGLRLRSHVPVGSCLSGGVDSSSVVCTIFEHFKKQDKDKSVETFTVAWKNEPIDESYWANVIVHYVQAKANWIFPSVDDLHDDLAKLIWHQEEPFGSLSIFAQWCAMKEARKKGIPVLLDGQGGDEIFLGYERYYAYFIMEMLKKAKVNLLFRELKQGVEHSKLNYKEMLKFLIYFNSNTLRSSYLNHRAKQFIHPDFLKRYDLSDRLRILRCGKTISDWQGLEIMTTQLPHLLKYADRNSTAFSIESRLPFLDYRVVEWAFSIPIELKIREGWTKYILRESMQGVVPEPIRRRKNKIGFQVPQNKLLHSLLPQIKYIISSDLRLGKYIKEDWFKNRMIELKANEDNIFWKALNLELWLRAFFS